MSISQAETLIDAMKVSFAAALRAPDGVGAPVVLLWTDADAQWKPLLPALQKILPQLYLLGAYAPDEHRGPVIWLKCIVERTLPDVAPKDGVVPILYLPKVGHQDLRAAGDCNPLLQPLIELQYRGGVWHQRNGRDWTVEAFLTSDDALALDIARDSRTRDAMLRALPLLATEPLRSLRGNHLEADDFDRLLVGDPVRDLLRWLSEPEPFQAQADQGRWQTFRDICARDFSFDPETDGPLVAAESLMHGGGKWDDAWERFLEAPTAYPGIAEQLLHARPKDLLSDRSRQPSYNREQEDKLRRDLEAAAALSHQDACSKIKQFEKGHAERRNWVWAKLEQTSLASVLEPLSRLAATACQPIGGTNASSIAEDYAAGGWRCDRAALDALAMATTPSNAELVGKVVRTLYEPWLDKTARAFQEKLSAENARDIATGVNSQKDSCVLFADGLRFDIATALQERLETRGLKVQLEHRISALPTVTATAKPLASPAGVSCQGDVAADDFTPTLAASGKPATAPRLRDEMARAGVEVMGIGETKIATGGDAGGWSEIGKLDEMGHSLGVRLVQHIEEELEIIADRVFSLLNAGWISVRIVTDHGWLLLPGGLPKVEMPPYLVASKWSRCATVKGESATDIPTYPWHWNNHVRIASPPGIGSFIANTEYAHGGVSPQECVVPELVVTRGEQSVQAKIREISWRGMRCRISVETNASELQADIRLNYKQAATSIAASAKGLGSHGEASLAVADDSHEGAAATVVVVDPSGHVLDYMPTTVGEEK